MDAHTAAGAVGSPSDSHITSAAVSNPNISTATKKRKIKYPTLYRTTQLDGLSIFYREEGPKDAPALFLLQELDNPKGLWADRAANETALANNLPSLQTTRTRYVGNHSNVERHAPDLWTDEFTFLNQPGQAEIQSGLFCGYRMNVDAYPKWQAWMHEEQSRHLAISGKYDLSFELSEPEADRRDVPNADVHVLEAGHFALDTAADEIADLIKNFMGSSERTQPTSSAAAFAFGR
jgi:hypothetical protein